ncbi:MAG: beta/gamma crystallin domain-containing protein [Betaproteobacteria bacterium]
MKSGRVLATILAAGAAGALSSAYAADDNRPGGPKDKGKEQSSTDGSSSGTKQSAAAPGTPVIVLVPIAIATTETFGDGCWVRLHDRTNFRGNQLSLVGPVDMPNMRTAFGTDWGGEFDSIAVGPKATVTVYDNENYKDKAATFKPGQKIADMGDKQIGPFEDIRSLKIACAGGGPTAKQQSPGEASAPAAGGGTKSDTGGSRSSGSAK